MVEEKIRRLNQRVSGGISSAMATPTDRATGQVISDIVPQLVDFLIARGVRGLFTGGTTGEGVLLDIDQRLVLHEATVSAAAGRVPVLVHAGGLRTETAVELARHAADIGPARATIQGGLDRGLQRLTHAGSCSTRRSNPPNRRAARL